MPILRMSCRSMVSKPSRGTSPEGRIVRRPTAAGAVHEFDSSDGAGPGDEGLCVRHLICAGAEISFLRCDNRVLPEVSGQKLVEARCSARRLDITGDQFQT
jgi:hypothetical protein